MWPEHDARVRRANWRSAPRYRIVAETDIIAHLQVLGWCLRSDGKAAIDAEIAAALDEAVRLGLPYQQTAAGRRFDPVETLNFLKWAGMAGILAVWERALVPTARMLVAGGLAVPPSAGFTVDFARTFNLARARHGRRLRLRLPIALGQGGRELVRIELPENNPLPMRVAGGGSWIEALAEPDHAETLTLRARFHLAATPPGRPPPEDDGADPCYLAAHEGLIRITARIVALAHKITAAAADDRERAALLFAFMLDRLSLGLVHHDLAESAESAQEWVLDNGWFDCQLGSALLVALCRAVGVPARLLSGHLLYTASTTVHYWAEIWDKAAGWQAYDLFTWDLSCAGRDAAWRTMLAGHVDPRLTTACLPARFPGAAGVPIPASWTISVSADDGAVTTRLLCIDTGALVYADSVRVSSLNVS